MKKLKLTLLFLIAAMFAGGCGNQSVNTVDVSTGEEANAQIQNTPAPKETEQSNSQEEKKDAAVLKRADKDYYVEMTLDSQALADNLYGNDPQQTVSVYLPPSYYDSDKSYPVVYYLHGFGESAISFIRKNIEEADQAFANGGKEFILAGVKGSGSLGGSFYVNSPVSGNWEDYTINEVVPLVDENFRTIKDSTSRGICGFSMGGFGAINLSLKHPDVFGAVLAMSPGLLEDGGLAEAMETWKGDMGFQKAYAQAFSPNPDTELFGNVPQFNNTPEDDAVIKDWENGFGSLDSKVADYLSLNQPLNAVRIIYGEKDYYTWIPKGCVSFSEILAQNKIPYTIESTGRAHSIPDYVVSEEIIPFFNENLAYE